MNDNESALGPVGRELRRKLVDKLTPTYLEIADESNRHHGHAGAHPSGESHFRVEIDSPLFEGLTRIGQHRLIHDALSQELASRVHALNIVIAKR
jgi:BolA family transcriptional regulator, general stress-responsive regulator